jgi:hypothetical protein
MHVYMYVCMHARMKIRHFEVISDTFNVQAYRICTYEVLHNIKNASVHAVEAPQKPLLRK